MIPESLTQLDRWVVWRNDSIAGGRTTKVPYQASNWPQRARSNDPSTWATYQQAVAQAESDPSIAGIGIMLGDLGDGRNLCGIDLDDCIVDGKVVDQAAGIIQSIPTYWEVSPSTFGVKGFGYGKKPEGSRSVCTPDGFARLEIYDHGRWFAVTGDYIAGDAVVDVQQPLSAILEEYGLAPTRSPEPVQPILVRPRQDGLSKLARASAYLATVDPAIEGAGGHSALFRAACVLVNGFDLSRSEAIQLLASEYNPRCCPPWDLGNTSEKREFERKVDQAMKAQHEHPRGYLLDDAAFDSPAPMIGIDFAAIARNGRKVSEMTPKTDTEPQDAKSDALPPTVKNVPIPKHLLEAPGLLGRVSGWIRATANQDQPELALANSVAFVGALLGKKVRTPNNARTNFYTLGVGESCCGKDHSRQQINALVEYAAVTDILAGESVTSERAVMNVAARKTGTLMQRDEIGHFFSSMASGAASTHEKAIIPTLTKLFTSAGTTVCGKEFADQDKDPRIDIKEPCLCLYGTATPGQLFSSFRADQIADGFIGRLLIFASQDASPEWNDVADKMPPKDLCDTVARWGAFSPQAPEGTGNIAAATYGAQIVPYTDEARAVLSAFRTRTAELRKQMMQCQGGESLHPLWGRAAEQAEKLALIASMDEPTDHLRITGGAMRWATELISALVSGLIDVAEREVSENGHDRIVNQILAMIKAAGRGGIARASISRKFRKIKAKDRDDILTDLTRDGLVRKDAKKVGRGRPSEWYFYEGD